MGNRKLALNSESRKKKTHNKENGRNREKAQMNIKRKK